MSVPSDAIIDVTPIQVRKIQSKMRTKLAVVGIGAIALLAAVGAGGWWMLSGSAGDQTSSAASGSGKSSYIEAPAVTVNLRGGDQQARFLKLRFIIVASDPGKAESIKERMPLVLDALQPFLRELRPEDLAGSAAVFRIKEEMMARATQALGAGAVRDILIQDLLQQ
jgi:flagellar FliL protein